MSAFINSLLLRRKQQEADAKDHERFLAQAKGDPGPQGPAGDPGPMPDHRWIGTKLRFRRPDGSWGAAVDLAGKEGKPGKDGGIVMMAGGRAGGGLSDLLPGAEGTEPTGIAVAQAGQWVNLSWPAFISTIAGAIDMQSEFSRRTDFVGDNLLYRGEAAPGAAESDPVWRIRRIEFAPDGDVTEQWAGGSAGFEHAWSDRAALNYQ